MLNLQKEDGTTEEETYMINNPGLNIGNFVMNRYTEPVGFAKLVSQTSGHICELEFKALNSGKVEERGLLIGTIKDKDGQLKIKI